MWVLIYDLSEDTIVWIYEVFSSRLLFVVYAVQNLRGIFIFELQTIFVKYGVNIVDTWFQYR